MPTSIPIAAFVLGAILLLLALLGGGFKIFGAEIPGGIPRNTRIVAGILSAILLIFVLLSACISPDLVRELIQPTPKKPPKWEAISGEWKGPDKDGVIWGKAEDFDALYLFKDTFRDFVFSAKVAAENREASLAFRMAKDGENGYLVIFVPEGSKGGNPGLYLAKRVKN